MDINLFISLAIGVAAFMESVKATFLKPLRVRYPQFASAYVPTVHVIAFLSAFAVAWLADADILAYYGYAVVDPIGHIATAFTIAFGEQVAHMIYDLLGAGKDMAEQRAGKVG